MVVCCCSLFDSSVKFGPGLLLFSIVVVVVVVVDVVVGLLLLLSVMWEAV